MNALIDYQISEQAGRRYAVLPLEQFTALVERAGEVDALTLPHEIVSRHLVDDVPLTRCWREYLDITQAELARRLSVSQAQVAQWESASASSVLAARHRPGGDSLTSESNEPNATLAVVSTNA